MLGLKLNHVSKRGAWRDRLVYSWYHCILNRGNIGTVTVLSWPISFPRCHYLDVHSVTVAWLYLLKLSKCLAKYLPVISHDTYYVAFTRHCLSQGCIHLWHLITSRLWTSWICTPKTLTISYCTSLPNIIKPVMHFRNNPEYAIAVLPSVFLPFHHTYKWNKNYHMYFHIRIFYSS